jgi:DNA-binding MarR family transcriptional regulator
MATTLDKRQLAVWRAFLEVQSTVIRALEREIQQEQGLPLTWYEVLVHLSEALGGRLRHQALAKSLLLSRSGVTRLVDRMAAAGLVRREPDPDDRRGSYVIITEAGKDALLRAAPGHSREVVQHFIRHLGAEDIQVLQSVFAKILQGEKGAWGDDSGGDVGANRKPGNLTR